MKHLSVKQKLTLWITLLMLLLSTLVLGFMVAVSSSVVTENAYDQLTSAVQNNLSGISRENGSLKFSEGFSFTNNGVYTVIYSDSGALLAGQLPLAFPEGTALENGAIRPVQGVDDSYYALDLWLCLLYTSWGNNNQLIFWRNKTCAQLSRWSVRTARALSLRYPTRCTGIG